MKGKLFVLSLAVAAFACIMIAVSPVDFSSAEESGELPIGNMTYTLDDSTHTATLVDVQEAVKDLVIPVSVEYNSQTYQVKGIDGNAVSCSGVETVEILADLDTIETYAFTSTTIKQFKDYDNSKFMAVNGVLYSCNGTSDTILRYPAAKEDVSFNIDDSVVGIAPAAFSSCTLLKEITFSNCHITEIAFNTFFGCTGLEKIGFHDGYNHLPDSVIIVGGFAFSNCSSLKDLWTPDSLRIIDYDAFVGCGFTKVHLNYGLTRIMEGAFSDCQNLQAFEGLSDELKGYNTYANIDGVLYFDGKASKSLFCFPAGKKIDGGVFTIPDTVDYIEIAAFSGNQSLTTIQINKKITEISASCFSHCTSLQKAVLTSKVVSIEASAFSGCKSLTAIEGWDGVTGIEALAFTDTGFTELTLPESIRYVGIMAFSNSKLERITVPDASVEIDSYAFLECGSLKEITFLGDRMTLDEASLDVGSADIGVREVTVNIIRTASIPSGTVSDEYTVLNIEKEGEHPYPYENFIGVAICLLALFGVVMVIREV